MVPAFPGSNPGAPANPFYTIYKTTFIQTGEFYIGKHKTYELNDGYLGSGIKITNYIRKYGKDAFQKEILYVFSNPSLMDAKEAEIVTTELCMTPLCMNLAPGGKGGWSLTATRFKGRQHTQESRTKTSKTRTGQTRSDEARLKSSISQKGISVPSRGTSNPKSEIHKANISLALQGQIRTIDSIQKQIATRTKLCYIWISNPILQISKMIPSHDIGQYVDWIKGRKF